MSDPNYSRDQLINSNFNAIRQLRADHDALVARMADIEARLQRRGIAPTLDESEYITNGN